MKISRKQLEHIVTESISKHLNQNKSLKEVESDNDDANIFTTISHDELEKRINSLLQNTTDSTITDIIVNCWDNLCTYWQHYNDIIYAKKYANVNDEYNIDKELKSYAVDDMIRMIQYNTDDLNPDDRYYSFTNKGLYSFTSLASKICPINAYTFANFLQEIEGYIIDDDVYINFANLLKLKQ